MNLNEDLMKKLLQMQIAAPQLEYYKENKFISFCLSLLSKKAPVVKRVIEDLSLGEDEVIEYIRALRELNCLSIQDDKLLARVSKIKKVDEKYDESILDIISHLGKLTKKTLKITPLREKRLKSLLSSKEYTVRDFKALHEYFVKSWGSNANMKQYLVPETLYNEKFQNRIETSRSHKENLHSYFQEIEVLYEAFPEMFRAEVPQKTHMKNIRLLNRSTPDNCVEVEVEDDSKNIPHNLKVSIVHWLEEGYSVESIENTIRKTVESWSKKRSLASYISVSKILDDKFPDRARVVDRLIKKEQLPLLKDSASTVDAWMPNKQG